MISKKELAQKYLPYYTPQAAVHRLMAWIRQIPELMSKLAEIGYRDRQRLLTPQQVELIECYLGEAR